MLINVITLVKYLHIVSLIQDLHVMPVKIMPFQKPYVFRSCWVHKHILTANMRQKIALDHGEIIDISIDIDIPTKAPVYLQIHDVEPQNACSNRISPFYVATEHCVPGREPPLFANS